MSFHLQQVYSLIFTCSPLSQALAEQQRAQQLAQQQAAGAAQPQGGAAQPQAQPQAAAAGAQAAGVPQPGAAAVPNTAVLVRSLTLQFV